MLVGEVKPKLQEAIAKLAKVKVPSEEQEHVAERAASSVNAAVGEFISCWQELEGAIGDSMLKFGLPSRRMIHSGEELLRRGILAPAEVAAYESVRQFRNRIVHGPATDAGPETIQAHVIDLQRILSCVEDGAYVDYLRALDPANLNAEIDNRIAETNDAIIDSEAFAAAMAETNASSFSLDEYEFDDITFEDGHCVAHLTYSASGEQDDEKMLLGDKVTGSARVVIDGHRNVTYDDITATVDRDDSNGEASDDGEA